MTIERTAIEAVFGPTPFPHALFYARPGGLRFELSEGPDAISMFLSALSKATVVCEEVFSDAQPLGVCLSSYAGGSPMAWRDPLRTLRRGGVRIGRPRAAWVEVEPKQAVFEAGPSRLFVAFALPRRLLPSLLWFALAPDLGIEPNPRCKVHLFDLVRGLVVHPYEDRGMDGVGTDHGLLQSLYDRHGAWLLDHDRPAMDATFAR